MATNFTTTVTGINIAPQNTVPPSTDGDIRYNSTTNQLELYDGAVDPILTVNSINNPSAGLSIPNANLAPMPADTIKGNGTGSSTTPQDLTTTQVTALLNVFTPSLQGLTPASGGGTTDFLRADGTWQPVSGSDAVSGGSNLITVGGITYVSSSGTITEDATNLFWDDADGLLGVGTNSPIGTIHIQSSGSSILNETNSGAGGGGDASFFTARRSRGTAGSKTGILNNDIITTYLSQGYGTTTYQNAAELSFNAAQDFSDSASGTNMLLQLAPTGSTSPRKSLQVSSNNSITYYAPNGSQNITLSVSNSTTSYAMVWPTTQGSTGQVLTDSDGAGTLTWSTPSITGANQTLSNLTSPVAINQALLPSSAGSENLGSDSVPWGTLYSNFIITPPNPTTQVLSNGNQINPTSTFIIVSSAGPVTLNASPILSGSFEGQELRILNGGGSTITIPVNSGNMTSGTGSNFTGALTVNRVAQFVYFGGGWFTL